MERMTQSFEDRTTLEEEPRGGQGKSVHHLEIEGIYRQIHPDYEEVARKSLTALGLRLNSNCHLEWREVATHMGMFAAWQCQAATFAAQSLLHRAIRELRESQRHTPSTCAERIIQDSVSLLNFPDQIAEHKLDAS